MREDELQYHKTIEERLDSIKEDYSVQSYTTKSGKKVKTHTRSGEKELKVRIKKLTNQRKSTIKHLNRIFKGKGVYLKSDKKYFLDDESRLYKTINTLQTELILLKKNNKNL